MLVSDDKVKTANLKQEIQFESFEKKIEAENRLDFKNIVESLMKLLDNSTLDSHSFNNCWMHLLNATMLNVKLNHSAASLNDTKWSSKN